MKEIETAEAFVAGLAEAWGGMPSPVAAVRARDAQIAEALRRFADDRDRAGLSTLAGALRLFARKLGGAS